MTLSDLTDRGFSVRIDIAGQLQVGPSKRLTPALRAAIKTSRDSLYREVIERDAKESDKIREKVCRG